MNARNLRRSAVQADWTLRYAEPAEFDDVAALLLRANDEYRDAVPAAVFAAYCDNLCRLALDPAAQDDCEILVIGAARGRDRGLLGTVTFFPDAASEGLGLPKGWAGLRALAVDPAARGCGLGRRLAEAVIGRAQAIGAPILSLHNAAFQAAARKLYLDLGFVRCPQYDFDAAAKTGARTGAKTGIKTGAKARGARLPIEAFALRLA